MFEWKQIICHYNSIPSTLGFYNSKSTKSDPTIEFSSYRLQDSKWNFKKSWKKTLRNPKCPKPNLNTQFWIKNPNPNQSCIKRIMWKGKCSSINFFKYYDRRKISFWQNSSAIETRSTKIWKFSKRLSKLGN